MPQNYAGAMQTVESGSITAEDAQASNTSITSRLSSKAQPVNAAAVQGSPSQQTYAPREITSKRTARSDTYLNKDGTFTQKNYMASKYFKKDGQWQNINTGLIEDKNAGDSGNIFGKALGWVESLVSSATTFTVKDNDWQARFAPSNAEQGMVRIKQGNSQISFSPVNAKKVTPIITKDKKGVQTVHYYDLWPGVNVEYVVGSDQVKENIILKNKNAASKISFKLGGAKLTASQDRAGGYKVSGALNNEFGITSPNLVLNNFGYASQNTGLKQDYKNSTLTVSVSSDYLKTLPDKAFPAVIDPGVYHSWFNDGTTWYYSSSKTDGTVCYPGTCDLYSGSLFDSNGYLQYWSGTFHAPYSIFSQPHVKLKHANLHLTQRNASYWTGTLDAHTYYVGYSTGSCYDCTLKDGSGQYLIFDSGTIGTSGDIDVTNFYASMINTNNFGAWIRLFGEDGTYSSFKAFDTDASYVDFTYLNEPAAPAITTPIVDQTFVDPQVSFRFNTVQPNNGPVPLQYELMVSSGDNGMGMVMSSGKVSGNLWTIPDGMLQDGSTYYVKARSYDPANDLYGQWGAPVRFKINMRTGKDKTQTYDTLGPVSVDLATGNLTTSAGSHTTTALGGSLGISLDYNTPFKSRSGLVGQYWDVPDNYSGLTPTDAAKITRIDQNIDFSWNTDSPQPGNIDSDWFYAKWSGYFVAPATGTYYFGGNNDDFLTITVDGQNLYTNGGCYSGICYGSNGIALTAGQTVSFASEYMDVTGPAYAHIYVKGAVSEQIVPQDWFKTGVRSTSQNRGLAGYYYTDDGTHNLDSATKTQFLGRTDSLLSFNWGNGSPIANGPTDNYMARWNGYFIAPKTATYYFGTKADDGTRIKINNTQVLDNWVLGAHGLIYGSSITLTAGQTVPITVDYFEVGGDANMALYVKGATSQELEEQLVPTAWLTPKAQVLPDGWNLGLDADGSLNYDHIKVNQNSAVLTDSTGSTHEYTWTGSAYKPPVNEDGQLTRNEDNTYTLQDTDGRTYVFNNDGTLKSVTNPTDDRKPAALEYTYASINGGAAALTQITDPVNTGKWAKLYYSGNANCTAAPSGFDTAAPAGMLCAVITNDGRTTSFYYKDSQLARIVKPGNETTDYQYETLTNNSQTIGYRIVSIRDALANDAIAAGVRNNDNTTNAQIAYDQLGRVTSVTQPSPQANTARQKHTIEYLPGALDKTYFGATKQHILAQEPSGTITPSSEPNGHTRKIEYDALYRTTKDTDIAGLSTTATYHPQKDLQYTTTDPTSLTTSAIYDDEDRPIESYGPAPSTWFTTAYNPATTQTDTLPISTYASQIPKTTTSYDQGIQGTQVAWYNAKGNSLTGSPKLHTTGIIATDPTRLGFTGSAPITPDSGMDGYGLTSTGRIRFPQTGIYTFKVWHDDGLRIYIDDQLRADDWTKRTEGGATNYFTFTLNAEANKPYRFRLDYIHTGTPGWFEVWTSGPGITDTSGQGLGSNHLSFLTPDYSLTTSTTVYDSQTGDVTTTTNYGTNPELGLAQSMTIGDLTTSNTYETQGTGYLRKTSKTLPGGNTYTYNYYTATETRANPCVSGSAAAAQGGMAKTKNWPDPDSSGPKTPMTSETVYDAAGRITATRMNNDPWTCTTYDERGRTVSTVTPDITNNGTTRPGRTVTANYAVGGNPLVTSSSDSTAGTTITTTDLLGQAVSATDTFGYQTTLTRDTFGKVTQKQSLKGTETITYDNLNRIAEYKLDNTTYATITYGQYSRVASIDYPQAKDTSTNNNLKLTQLTRDALQRTTGSTFTLSDLTTLTENISLSSQTNTILGYTTTRNGTTATASYQYDTNDRLTQAVVDNWQYQYSYDTQASACTSLPGYNANASKNGNRTATTITNTQNNTTTTTNSCYNQADQLTQSTDTQIGTPTYDDHGNTISLAGAGTPITFTYDASDQNTKIQQGTNRVEYTKTASGTVLTKKEYRNNTLDKVYRNAAGVLLTCSLTDQNNCNTTDKYIDLPGGVTLTLSPTNPDQTKQTIYSLKNFHGDTALTLNSQGAATSNVHMYDPYGQVLASSTWSTNNTTLTNSTDNPMGWAASPSRKAESSDLFTIPIIQMGARVYIPTLGRFLQVDPIEGGTSNDYVYPGDPLNSSDYTGTNAISDWATKKYQQAKGWVQDRWKNLQNLDKKRIETASKINNWCANGYWKDIACNGGVVLLTMGRGNAKSGKLFQSAQLKKLPDSYVKELQKKGVLDAHDAKKFQGDSRVNLYKDKDGNLYTKPQDGSGPGDPLYININNAGGL